jgi:hypothetical protein
MKKKYIIIWFIKLIKFLCNKIERPTLLEQQNYRPRKLYYIIRCTWNYCSILKQSLLKYLLL